MGTAVVALSPRSYYRLPWSLTDNGISWLEVTPRCNLACVGCYRSKTGAHKSLEEIAGDLEVFKRERISDCMSIAGGDPLVHPQIVDIVRMIREGGWKPVLNTNGLALTPELLKELKAAGVFGFTFHIDTSQVRTDADGQTERDLNRLRLKFAEMLAAEGGVSCSFNQTVTSATLDQVPDVVRWAVQHPDVVHTVVFILYREPRLAGDFDFFVGGRQIPLEATYEKTGDWGGQRTVKAPEVVARFREVDPGFEPSAYLNGTVDPDSMKWLMGTRVATGTETWGYVTPRFMETVQHVSHFFRNRWLSYSDPKLLRTGRATLFSFALIDRGMRKAAWRYVVSGLKNPLRFFRRAHLQTFTVIQPVDFMADGRMNMCDGCPDMTVHQGQMYWSCRLEEIKQYGCFVTAVPRVPAREAGKPSPEPVMPASVMPAPV